MNPLRQAVEHMQDLLSPAANKIRPPEPDDPDFFLKTDLACIAEEAFEAGCAALAGLAYKEPRPLAPTWLEDIQEMEPIAQPEYQALAFWTQTILDELALDKP